MRRIPLLLPSLLALAVAAPAAAGGAGLEGMARLIQDLDGSNPRINDTFVADQDGDYDYVRTFNGGGPSFGSLIVDGQADPFVHYELTLQNTRADGMPSNFDFGVAIQMVPFGAGVPLFGNMSIQLIDTSGDGDATLSALLISCADLTTFPPTGCKPDPIVQFFSLSEGDIANNFTVLQDMDLGGTVSLADGIQNYVGNGVSPVPNPAMGDWSEMGVTARFQLSHGDTVIINSFVGTVPEPSPALLLAIGLAALVALRRRAP